MQQWLTLCSLLLATLLVAFPQATPAGVSVVDEPLELAGEPKKLTPPPETLREFASVMDKWKENDPETVKALRPELDAFIRQHPDYSDSYAVRALADACYVNSKNYENITADINRAVALLPSEQGSRMFTVADLYAYRAKVDFDMSRYREAMDDLEAAMRKRVEDASKIFNIEGTQPDAKSGHCAWNQSEIDSLVQNFPRDYRSPLFRGLYFTFFTTFDEKYYERAIQEYRKAATLNPVSPMPHYFIGKSYTRSSIWTKAA